MKQLQYIQNGTDRMIFNLKAQDESAAILTEISETIDGQIDEGFE